MNGIVYELVDIYRDANGELEVHTRLYNTKEKAVQQLFTRMEEVRSSSEITFEWMDEEVFGQLEDKEENRYEFYLVKKEIE